MNSMTMDILIKMEAENVIEKLKNLDESQRLQFFNIVCKQYCVKCGQTMNQCHCEGDSI